MYSSNGVIEEINKTINDISVDRIIKIEKLKQLACIYWKIVFPEYGTDSYQLLSLEEKMLRWETARQKDLIDKYPNKEYIFYVLDWPASGGNFYWVK